MGRNSLSKSAAFDDNFAIGSPARANIEDKVIKDYTNLFCRHCDIELQFFIL